VLNRSSQEEPPFLADGLLKVGLRHYFTQSVLQHFYKLFQINAIVGIRKPITCYKNKMVPSHWRYSTNDLFCLFFANFFNALVYTSLFVLEIATTLVATGALFICLL
ncbi:MAG: hypothetical protein LRY30_01500, partial [Gammaproteobacteria bacterium]|nr:hypothetical protein [Gammaproteobacteria bacterium]